MRTITETFYLLIDMLEKAGVQTREDADADETVFILTHKGNKADISFSSVAHYVDATKESLDTFVGLQIAIMKMASYKPGCNYDGTIESEFN